jgi:transcriptional regulator of heat shock response
MELTLSPRQRILLKAIIQEFMDTAEAVGSLHLPEKYGLGVSPATIRNEMSRMSELGLIRKEHSSAGRVPTSIGYKFFLQEILDELEQMSVEKEMMIRDEVYKNRFDAEDLLRKSVKSLAEILGGVGVALFKNRVYYSGIADIMDIPEFQDMSVFKELMKILESSDRITSMFGNYEEAVGVSNDQVKVLFGEDSLGSGPLERVALVFGKIIMYRDEVGYLGILGSCRMNYSVVIPTVSRFVSTVNESLRGW